MKNTDKDTKLNKEEESSGSRILFFSVLMSGMFVLLIGYLCYFMVFQKEDVVTNPYNAKRQAILESRVVRGTIYDRNGERIAYTGNNEAGEEVRVYPYRNLFAHVVGYNINGKMGIEYSENYNLISSHESVANHIQNDLNNEKNKGDSVLTSLDVELQKAAYNALGVYKGCVIVTDVKTGAVLAMVSKPDFDPNEIGSIWEDVISDENSTVLLNRATAGQYAPGSTFKIFTTIEYMMENPDWKNYSYQCKGVFKDSEGDSIHCYGHTSHGSLDLYSSFARSCNSSFSNIGFKLDRDAFGEELNALYFNQALPGYFKTAKSKISMGSHVSDYDMLQNGIGQGAITLTPLHLNMITATIANGGTLYAPYVVTGIQSSDGNLIKSFGPDSQGRILPEELCLDMTELMKGVCQYGTAKSFKEESFTVAGKTGSAEFGTTEDAAHKGMMDSNAWFTGFAPADSPEVAITVIVEGMGNGGDYAVPIAKRVLECYFGYEE